MTRIKSGPHAYTSKFDHPDGEPGYIIHCQLCRKAGRSWSTRTLSRRVLGKRKQILMSLWENAMNLWVLHLRLHHPDEQPPEWQPSEDLDPRFADAEATIFDVTPEEELLRKIFGL